MKTLLAIALVVLSVINIIVHVIALRTLKKPDRSISRQYNCMIVSLMALMILCTLTVLFTA